MKNARALALGLLGLVPAAAIGVMILRYAVDVPFTDDWSTTVPALARYVEGDLTLADFTAQKGEHRVFFPRLWVFALTLLGGGDLRVAMWGNLLLGTVILGNAFVLTRRAAAEGATRWVWAYLLIALWLFSPVQWSNWLKGYQSAILLPSACVTGGLVLATAARPTLRSALGACVLCAISTFSVAHGFVAWLLVGPVFVGRAHAAALRARMLVLWGVALGVSAALFAYGYHVRSGNSPTWVFEQPLEALAFVLAVLGAPLAAGVPGRGAAVVAGAALLALLALLARTAWRGSKRTGDRRALEVALALAAYALLAAAMVCVGRGDTPHARPLASRYTTMSILLIVAVVLLAARAPLDRRWKALGGAVLAVLWLAGWPASLRETEANRELRRMGKACLAFVDVIDPPPEGLGLLGRKAVEHLAELRAMDRAGLLSPSLAGHRPHWLPEVELDVGTVDGVRRDPDGRWVVHGTLPATPDALTVSDGTPGDMRAVLVDNPRVRRDRVRMERADGGVRWEVFVAERWGLGVGDRVTFWTYDALTGAYQLLQGEVELR